MTNKKKVLFDPWSVVPEISPTVSDVSTFEEPDHFRGFREKLEEAEKERDEAIWSLQENPKLKLFDNKKYKSLKKTVAKQDEIIEALKKGIPYIRVPPIPPYRYRYRYRYWQRIHTDTDTDTDTRLMIHTDTDTDTDTAQKSIPIPIPIPILGQYRYDTDTDTRCITWVSIGMIPIPIPIPGR